jgi:phosphoribosylcarboxyaminoimidazole (NCAIR) mutase
MLSLTGGLGEEAVTVAAGFMVVEAFMAGEVFTAVEAFTAGAGSQAFTAGAGSAAFTGGAFTAGVSGGFTAMVVFSVPVSTGTLGGGAGVIPTIGVTRTTPITHIITRRTTVTMGMGTRRSPQDGFICASAAAHARQFKGLRSGLCRSVGG